MEFEEFYLAYIVDPVGLGLGLIERKYNEQAPDKMLVLVV
jgi:hypothetical protein